MILPRKYLILLPLLFLAACSTTHKKDERFYYRVANHEAALQRAVEADGKVYLQFSARVLTAALPAEKSKKALLSPAPQGPAGGQEISVLSVQWGNALKKTLAELTPQDKPLLLTAQNYELVLFRDKNGEIKLEDLKSLPPAVKPQGRLDEALLARTLTKYLAEEIQSLSAAGTKFLLTVEDAPLTSYIYIDTARGYSAALELPPYYKNKSASTKLSFSFNFIYNFFIKSQAFTVLKAPFTSAVRLVERAERAVVGTFAPPLHSARQAPAPAPASLDAAAFNAWLDREINKETYKADIKYFIDGSAFFTDFILAAEAAKDSIYLRLYLFNNDPYGLEIADILKRRSNQNVDVRVLIDNMGTVTAQNAAYGADIAQQGFVLNQNIVKYLKKDSQVKVRTHPNIWVTFDHGKLYLVDKQKAYVGGMNIGAEYRFDWHDMMFSLEGPVVDRLLNLFYEDWSFAGWTGDFGAAARKISSLERRAQNAARPGMIDVRILRTKPFDNEIYRAQLEAIKRAKNRIYIQNAYFANNKIVNELVRARARGVDVRVILPGDNNVSMMDANNIIMTNHLLKNDVKVYVYDGMSHVKAALYDDWACLGSANFDALSLFINKELSVAFSDKETVEELNEKLFQKDFKAARLVSEPLESGWSDYIVKYIAGRF